jgi:hypothetical protein
VRPNISEIATIAAELIAFSGWHIDFTDLANIPTNVVRVCVTTG